MRQANHQRSGRVISLGRLALAAVFLACITFLPSPFDDAYGKSVFYLIAGYTLLAIAYLALTWRDWWVEHATGVAAHAIDIAVFTLTVLLTEGFSSPFFSFFTFLLLSAMIRWGWRGTAVTGMLVLLLYFGAGALAMVMGTGDLEISRVVFRVTNLMVLPLLLIWFGINQGDRPTGEIELAGPGPALAGPPPLREALEHVRHFTDAQAVRLLYSEADEPWQRLLTLTADGYREQQLDPGEIEPSVTPELDNAFFIFDSGRRRALRREGTRARRLRPGEAPVAAPLLADMPIASGLSFPVRSELYEGRFFVFGVPGLCADDLRAGERLAETVSRALEHRSLMSFHEERTATRTRLAFSRDLHDGVVQLLAGTALRLEGVKRAAAAGRPVDEDVSNLQAELSAEQRALRRLMGRMRADVPADRIVDLDGSVAELIARMARQWPVRFEFEGARGLLAPATIAHEIHQLLREAIANAVRHGGADRISIVMAHASGTLTTRVSDSGSGFDPALGGAIPWSLEERVRALGGTIRVESDSTGSRIAFSLPVELAT
ncbi:ATP-binding protein [Sphingomonas sp.]|uniref:sensor histidine kinase n=1 Tax=Sphingomonas sp. TaxID=28214 RepID=UPI001EC0503D|nr:ATP-binding protein [Sphingomonas sp.]MBX3592888.1 ATP-binding protein [Sphingomonas sp.]